MPLARFWTQECRRYRWFQLVFTALTLNFVLPAFSYSFAPDAAVAQFLQVNRALGGAPYPFDEAHSHLWRYLGAANVMTLGLCCLLLQLDLRRFYPVLVPLTFMKLYAATSWLAGFLFAPGVPVFLAAAVLDYATSFAFVFFAARAHAEIAGKVDGALVPSPGALWRRS